MNTPRDPLSATLVESLEVQLKRLRSLCLVSVQSSWQVLPVSDLRGAMAALATAQLPDQGSSLPLDHRGYIVWPQGQQCLWLGQTLQWPEAINGFSVRGYQARLGLRWWAELAEIYVNGEHIQSGDLFDCFTRILLSSAVCPGDAVAIALKLVSPGHDQGALVQSQLMFESADSSLPEPSFIADELTVLSRYLQEFAPEQLPILAEAVNSLDWDTVGQRDRFIAALGALRQQLMSFSTWIKQRQIHCLGHAHLDLAWLWPVADTWAAAERTFTSVLALQQEFPELTYTHSSPALFAWLETYRPKLFGAIQHQVRQGKWAIDAGLWVEPELNLIGGEAIARQILYGQRYCQEKFGSISLVAWLPDTFGFCWQLPQLLSLGGVRYFATQKLRWNDTHEFPHHWFWWQGLDGTRLLSLTLPLIGADLDPVAMANYACAWEASTSLAHSLWLPGVGDHGGGPTRDMLTRSRRWASSPFFPRLVFSSAVEFLATLPGSTSPVNQPTSPDKQLPVWQDELYLELHRGCYTTHADQKWYNRRCEDMLYQAELFATIALRIAQQPYPKTRLEKAWKQTLFNQFHDILPGSSIPEVFIEANELWQTALQSSYEVLQEALAAISAEIELPRSPQAEAIPVFVFNALSWPRSEIVAVALPAEPQQASDSWQIVDTDGQCITTQIVSQVPQAAQQSYPPTGLATPHLLFQAEAVPAIGYRLFWLAPAPAPSPTPIPQTAPFTLENTCLKVEIDHASGALSSLYDKQQQREMLKGAGNELQAFSDRGQYWDAWNIAPDYQEHPLAAAQLISIQWAEQGPLRQTIQVTQQLGQSIFQHDYSLEKGSPLLRIKTTVNWQETQTLVKTAFFHTLKADTATYEIAFGAIERPTSGSPNEATAKWEVPALTWADVSQPEYGLSLLTDSKHGFDATPTCLRLSLLKAPLWPDATADRGTHQSTVAIYPHRYTHREAKTAHKARALNIPLQPYVAQASQLNAPSIQAKSLSFIELRQAEDFILSAFKPAEDSDQRFVVRLYEPYGQPGTCVISNQLKLNYIEEIDLLEASLVSNSTRNCLEGQMTVKPWQVTSISLAAELSQREQYI